jgi:5'-3' exonuclease
VLGASGDRDTFQLGSDRATILYPVRADEMVRIGPAEVRVRYGVDPQQVPDFIALPGDLSDKLPGAPGVGAVGAAALLRRYGTLEKALAAGRFPGPSRTTPDLPFDRPQWIAKRRYPLCAIKSRPGRVQPLSRRSGGSHNWQSGL